MKSIAESMTPEEQEAFFKGLSPAAAYRCLYDWSFWARPNQLPPPGDWVAWLLLAGRGFGKSRTGAEWIREEAESGRRKRLALVARTAGDIRNVMVEGESGILAISPKWCRPKYESSKCRLTWPNGTIATTYSADEPDMLRGPQHDGAWVDELACLASGTLIETETGPRPIEQINSGDRVYTRYGLRAVVRSWQSNPYAEVFRLKTTGEKTLVGTEKHRIWTRNRGFVPLCSLLPGDILEAWDMNTKESNGMAIFGGFGLTTIKIVGGSCCIVKNTLQSMGRSLMDGMSIILMAISKTTIFQTLRHCLQASINTGMIPVGLLLGPLSKEPTALGIHGKLKNQRCAHAQFVGETTNLLGREQSFAASIVQVLPITRLIPNLKKGVRICLNHLSHAWFAGSCLKNKTRGLSVAHENVVTLIVVGIDRLADLQPVYDLQIEEDHEYYANGILVHNSWTRPDAWDQLMFGLRMGDRPQVVVTTTPRPTKIIRALAASPTTYVTRGSTFDNRSNLAGAFFEKIVEKYEGTRLGRQEISGEILDDNPNALWQRKQIDDTRVDIHPSLSRIVIGVDPAVTSKADSDSTGIIAVGMDNRSPAHFYVLDDGSGIYTPDQWARMVVIMYHKHEADRVVAEVNQGGDMVESIIRQVDPDVSYVAVHATRGKIVRAEPIAALYEQCVAKGSLVTTARGKIPIEHVTTMDQVLTREGFRRVLWAGQTGVAPTIRIEAGDCCLFCTEDHPIFTMEENFIHAVALVPKKHNIVVWKTTLAPTVDLLSLRKVAAADPVVPSRDGKPASLSGHSLSSMASNTTNSLTVTGVRDAIQGTNYCTVPCGSMLMGQSLTANTSTTSMKTQAITALETWLCSRRSIIIRTISTHKRIRSSSAYPDRSGNGGRPENQPSISVSNADKNSFPPPPESDFAHRPAIVATGVGSVEKGPTVPVYNLSVEGTPEFFANGILVHNCRVHHAGSFPQLEDEMCEFDALTDQKSPDRMDALVWALTHLTEKSTSGFLQMSDEWRRNRA